MKRKLADEQVAVSQYLESLLDRESRRRAGVRPPPTDPFECWAFSVWGLRLTIPQADVRDVVADRSLLRNIGRTMQSRQAGATGLLGVFEYGREHISVIDVAEIAIPSAVRAELADARGAPAAVVLIQGGQAGIVCDDPPVVMTVAPEEVCWSALPNPRPWLAGVISNRCVLINAALLCPEFVAGPSGDRARSGQEK